LLIEKKSKRGRLIPLGVFAEAAAAFAAALPAFALVAETATATAATAAFVSAATAAATASVTTTAATSASASTCRARCKGTLLFRTSFHDFEWATSNVDIGQTIDGSTCLVIIGHFYKCETAGTAALAIKNDACVCDSTEALKSFAQFGIGEIIIEVTNVEVHLRLLIGDRLDIAHRF
jgi:hypothetical protein